MTIKKVEGLWILYSHGEIVECYDTKQEAQLALFDKTRPWKSLADTERSK